MNQKDLSSGETLMEVFFFCRRNEQFHDSIGIKSIQTERLGPKDTLSYLNKDFEEITHHFRFCLRAYRINDLNLFNVICILDFAWASPQAILFPPLQIIQIHNRN